MPNDPQKTSRNPHLTGAEKNERQTKQSWALPLSSYTEVPELYRPFFAPFQQAGKPFPKAVLTPTYAGFMNPEPEKLLFACDKQLYLLKNNAASFDVFCLPFAEITCIEYKAVLLDSTLCFYGSGTEAQTLREIVRFNTVSDFLFKPFIRQVRKYNFPEEAPLDFAFTKDLSFKSLKFANLCASSLLPGETVQQLIWQPEPRMRFLQRIQPTFYTPLFTSHALILTDHELILIHETEPQTRNDKYGSTSQYIPLQKVRSLRVTQTDSDLLCLEIFLVGEVTLRSYYRPNLVAELEKLCMQIPSSQ